MLTYHLQVYWWFIISLLGAILVFLLFVQGGQSMLLSSKRNRMQISLMVHSRLSAMSSVHAKAIFMVHGCSTSYCSSTGA